ncbi:hypothetical protein C2I36_12455 [Rhodobacteraceae bacterium WD3A24]|nr:hypothetical protein C2I36_12455 [Rhodobacteraceae bacterium WD3A24]
MRYGFFKALKDRRAPRDHAERSDAWLGGLAAGAGGAPAAGVVAGSHLATTMGWRPVEVLCAGDRVLTFDNGLQPISAVRRAALAPSAETPPWLRPLIAPAGALGNRDRLILLSEQAVIVESDHAEAACGEPFVLVPAGMLEGWRGIARAAASEPLDVVTLEFEDEQIVYANGWGLLHCPRSETARVVTLHPRGQPGAAYRRMSRLRLHDVVCDLHARDAARPIGADQAASERAASSG